jgi:hypothetical protein
MLAALFGLWFILAGQEPPFAHPCLMAPMSEVTPVAVVAGHLGGHSDAAAHGDHGAHAGHHMAGPGHGEHSQAPDTPAGECECIGDCCCVVPVPSVPQVAVIDLIAAPDVESATPDAPTAERTPTAPPRRQPFAIGPPNTPVA